MLAGQDAACSANRVGASVLNLGQRAAVASAVLTGIWILLMAVFPPPSAAWPLEQQARYVLNHSALWSGLMGVRTALTLVQVPLIASLVWVSAQLRPVRAIIAGLFAVLYVPFALTNNATQLALVPRLAGTVAGPGRPGELAGAFASWHMFSPTSVAYTFDVIGYGLYSLAFLLFGSALVSPPTAKALRVSGWLMLAEGVAGTLGFVGYALGQAVLEQGVLVSGVLVFLVYLALPFGLRAWARTATLEPATRQEGNA